MTDTLELLLDLFAGNPTAVGTEGGGCQRLDDHGAQLDVWKSYLAHHFHGTGGPIGVYPMCNDDQGRWFVKWGCIDYDMGEPDSLIHAYNTQRLLGRFDITSWIEVSRSKGHHLWTFCEGWVPAALMRRALVASQQLLGIPPREVNPKSEHLADGQLGNYVRAPYPGALGTADGFTADGRRMMLKVDQSVDTIYVAYRWTVHEWAPQAHPTRVPATSLEALARRYVPPAEPLAQVQADPSLEATELARKLSGLAYTIWRDGPLDGDRSNALWRLACKLAECVPPVTPTEALTLVVDADARWGKHHLRGDAETYLPKMIARAYGQKGHA